MRFNKIHIAAYGPFTGLEMGLPRTGGDFHLIYGPNEAGKSSLLRSLRALLFGIHAQTTDNFLHGYGQMRIAAELENKDGSTRWFQRRKGNKNTLLDEKEAAIPESDLGDFLKGVDAGYFDSLFGLGSEELRRGADTLLRGEGRLGEALFSASLGGTPVDKVIQSLEAEAASLFKGRAGSSEIRVARRELDEALRQSKDSVIKAEDWEKIQLAIQRLNEQLDGQSTEKNHLALRKSWLERCRDASPSVGKLRECLRQLDALPHIPDLGESFGTEIREARRQLQAATLQIDAMQQEMDALRHRLQAITLAPTVLAAASGIEKLHAGIGVYRQWKQNLAEHLAEASSRKLGIDATCKDLEISTPIAELDGMRISQVSFVEAEGKAAALQRITGELADAEKKSRALESEIQSLKEKQPRADAADITVIGQAIQETKALEETARHLAASAATNHKLRGELKNLQRSLTGCTADLERISLLEIPIKSTIERFHEEFDQLKRKKLDLESRRKDEQTKMDAAQAEIERLTRQREIPDLQDLEVARAHRERGWKLVLAAWKAGNAGEDLVEGVPLDVSYPQAVAAADEVADRLRAEADIVAQVEEKRSQAGLAGRELERIARDESALAEEEQALTQSWTAAWQGAGLVPLSPREMKEWRDHWEDFRRVWNEWESNTQRWTADCTRVEMAETLLRQTLGCDRGSLTDLLAEANARVAAHNQAMGAISQAREQIAGKEQEHKTLCGLLPDLQSKRDSARAEWIACLKAVSLPETLAPDAAIGLLRARREMFLGYDQWLSLNQSCKHLRTKIDAYEAEVAAAMHAQNLESRNPEADAELLWNTLETARMAQRDHDALRIRIEEVKGNLVQAGKQAAQLREGFHQMLGMAALTDEKDLDEFLMHHDGKKSLMERMRTLRDTLAGFARSESVEDFIARVEQENTDPPDGELLEIDARLAELEPEIDATRSQLQDANQQRLAMEAASDEAARLAQQAENTMASLQQKAERFARLQVAITLLKSRIDRFREQNQGPFMEKASHWFSEITGSAFSGIATTYDDGDKPLIAGQRKEDSANRIVPVSGMSEGTRDQLYLALRLAGLELHLADHEPMPLILDDLLVHFDDGRALRALSALRDFGQRSQVLLFTHHAHLVDLVKHQWGSDGFHYHPLAGA